MDSSKYIFLVFAIALLSTESLGKVNVLLEVPVTTPGPDITATMVRITLPPGDEGSPAHLHSGSLTGYVLEGEFLFQMEGDPLRILSAGEVFYEDDNVVHVWGANASNATACIIIATVFGRKGRQTTTYLENYPRGTYASALVQAQRTQVESGNGWERQGNTEWSK